MKFTAFNNPLTPEARYWLGFLLSDGYLCGNKVNIRLGLLDRVHLDKFLKFLKSESKVYILENQDTTFGKAEYALVSIKSTPLVQRLRGLGIEYRKSLTAKPLLGLEKDPDFWRGVIDGDGSLRIRKIYNGWYPEISICGTQAVVQGFADFCTYLVPGRSAKITKRKDREHYGFAVGAKRAKAIVSILYYPNCVGLARKIVIAGRIKQ